MFPVHRWDAGWVPQQRLGLDLERPTPDRTGRSHDTHWRAYNGLLDDFRIYNRVLTGPEIAQVASTGALVDDAALKVRFNFNSPPSGYTLTWPGTGTLEGATDLSSPVTWTPLPNSHSPYFVRPGDAPLLFYRAVGQ